MVTIMVANVERKEIFILGAHTGIGDTPFLSGF